MRSNKVATSYKKLIMNMSKGIETAHGRIKLLYETLLSNLNKIEDKHPKTDFLSFGKCLNALKILSASLDMKQGKDLAKNLSDLYAYCSEQLKEYLENKDERKIVEIKNIISGLLEAWEEIKE